ncbi:MAG: hypothetical protein JWP81_4070 [Ferruginibacter sp.]|nr:hypothetical protein [Ferruginibacter sp.]
MTIALPYSVWATISASALAGQGLFSMVTIAYHQKTSKETNTVPTLNKSVISH